MKIEMKYMWNGLSQTDVSWITDKFSNPVQYMHYLPYGQLLANQKATTYDERYKFIGKERDWESGYDYFGARYYISPFLHWMSVDPLSDEDPGIPPYAYCSWNPINKIDPNGLSTHTDEDGNVVAVYDDRDLSIYKHSNSKLSSWGDVYENHLTTDDADIMGQSLHAHSFADQNSYNKNGITKHAEGMKIDFGSSVLGNEVMSVILSNPSLIEYALNAKHKGVWDLKEHYKTGSQIFYNIYASPRDAGNFLAGAIKGKSGILSPIVQFGYGAYNIAGNNMAKTGLITLGTSLLICQSPALGLQTAALIMNGEDKLTQLSINIGFNYVRK